MPEHLIGIILCTGARLALQLAGIGHDGLCLLLGDAHDLLLGGDGHRLAARILDEAVRLILRILQERLALAHDLASLSELSWEDVADLIHDLEGSGDVHLPHVAFAENRLRVFQQYGQLFEKSQYSCFVHLSPSLKATSQETKRARIHDSP